MDDTKPPAGTPAPARVSRARWMVALVVVALAVAVVLAVPLLFGQSATPTALQYVPGDAALVLEVRMDLPGDQLQHVGNLLAHFPGFADQSTLSTKIDEGMRRLINNVTGSSVDYVNDIKPWLAGPAYVGVMAPALATTSGTGNAVISATTTGSVACSAVFKGRTVTHESYRGLDLVSGLQPNVTCVIDGRQALLGDTATVKLALDAKANGTGIDRSTRYATARSALGEDRLATVFVSGPALASIMPGASAAPGASTTSSEMLQALTGPLPDWTMVGVRAEDDALVVDSVAARPNTSTGPDASLGLASLPPTHVSVLAPMVPKDTLFFVENQGTGVALANLFTRMRTIPELQQPLQTLDGLGGVSKLFGWVDDAGLAVSVDGTTPEGTLLLVAKDEGTASSTVAQLDAVLTLLGQGKIELTKATIDGVEVTTVTIPDPSQVLPSSQLQGLSLPTTPISFVVAAKGKVILLATSQAAMTSILDVTTGNSLADDPTFKLAGQHGLANSRTTLYVAAGATVGLVQRLLPPDQAASFTSDVLPYLAPLQSVSSTATEDATASRSRFVILVSKP